MRVLYHPIPFPFAVRIADQTAGWPRILRVGPGSRRRWQIATMSEGKRRIPQVSIVFFLAPFVSWSPFDALVCDCLAMSIPVLCAKTMPF